MVLPIFAAAGKIGLALAKKKALRDAIAKGSQLFRGSRAAKAVADITGAGSLVKGVKAIKSGKGIVQKLKGLAGVIAGGLGLKFTKDLLTGEEVESTSTVARADDPFQAEEGFPDSPVQPAQLTPTTAPIFDLPDILPDFIEQRLEALTPQQLGLLAAGAGAVGLGGAAAFLSRDKLAEVLGEHAFLNGAPVTVNGVPKKKSSKKRKAPGKPAKKIDRSMKGLAKKWKTLSPSSKAKYEGKFSDYVKVKREAIRAKKPSRKTSPKRKTSTKRKASGSAKKQQSKMKTAAAKWRKMSAAAKAKTSYQKFISKELKK